MYGSEAVIVSDVKLSEGLLSFVRVQTRTLLFLPYSAISWFFDFIVFHEGSSWIVYKFLDDGFWGSSIQILASLRFHIK